MKKLSLIIIVLVAFATSSSYAWMVCANSEDHPGRGDTQYLVTIVPAGHSFWVLIDCHGTPDYPSRAFAGGLNFYHEVRNGDKALYVEYPVSPFERVLCLYAETEKYNARAYGGAPSY